LEGVEEEIILCVFVLVLVFLVGTEGTKGVGGTGVARAAGAGVAAGTTMVSRTGSRTTDDTCFLNLPVLDLTGII
jgi:hypothetical protein